MGGYGEGSIGKLKRLIHSTKEGFAFNVILKFLRSKTLSSLASQLQNNLVGSDSSYTATVAEMVKVLEHVAEKDSTLNGMPDCTNETSGRKDKNNQNLVGYKTLELPSPITSGSMVIPVAIHKPTNNILIYYKNEDVFRQCKVIRATEEVKVCGADYFYFDNGRNNIDAGTIDKKDLVVGLMLRHKVTKKLYYTINFDWEELMKHNNSTIVFAPSRFENAMY